MDSNNEIKEISVALNELFEKVEKLKLKLDSLCKQTGGCDHIKAINREILKKKELINGTYINAFREEE
jgi:hypothetical protein